MSDRLEVLFVDGEPAALAATANLMRRERERWNAAFAGSFAQAREMLAARRFDVVVTDVHLGDGSAIDLLGWVRTAHPQAARVVLSAESASELIARLLPVAHQFIGKPCDSATLRAALERTHRLSRLLADPALRRAVGVAEGLPQLPGTYTAIESSLARPNASLRDVSAIIERDAVASARVLQVANSAFFRASRTLASVQAATTHLGIETVKTLVLSAHLLASERIPGAIQRALGSLQSRAMRRVALVRAFIPRSKSIETASCAALLADLGALVLARSGVQAYAGVLGEAGAGGLGAAERDRYGVDHGEVGAYLLGMWGLPFGLVETIAFHHRPALVTEGDTVALAALHAADAVVDGNNEGIDFSVLAAAGLPGSREALAEAVDAAALAVA